MSTFGNACIDRGDGFGGVTTAFDNVNPITEYGIVTQICIYLSVYQAGHYGKVKVFRPNGSNIDFVGESSLQVVVNGANTFTGLNIVVIPGDLVGYYQDSGQISIRMTSSGANSFYWMDGDITSSNPLSSWTGYPYIMSILATYTLTLSNVYVNTSTGNDTYAGDSCVAGHPVLTFAKAYELLASGGTIHVCNNLADFSTETVTLNKTFSIDLNGADGYFYMPQAS